MQRECCNFTHQNWSIDGLLVQLTVFQAIMSVRQQYAIKILVKGATPQTLAEALPITSGLVGTHLSLKVVSSSICITSSFNENY